MKKYIGYSLKKVLHLQITEKIGAPFIFFTGVFYANNTPLTEMVTSTRTKLAVMPTNLN